MNTKQVIVIRKMGMRRGKECSQAAHASMKWLTKRLEPIDFVRTKKGIQHAIWLTEAEKDWVNGVFTKITCRVDSEEELLDIYNRAKAKTCLAIGPDLTERIDPVTKHLKLY